MRDALLICGTIAAATKATRVYSANVLDLGSTSQYLDRVDACACFKLGKKVTSGDTFAMEVYDSDDNSTFAKVAESAAIASGNAGDIIKVPVGKVRRYVKLACYPNSSGTLVAQNIDSWIAFDAD